MKVIAIDDCALVREGFISLFANNPDIQVIGQAATVPEAVKIINNLNPDLALIDLKLGDENGLDIVKQIRKKGGLVKFIIFSSVNNKEVFEKAYELGVEGYILKGALLEEIIHAINMIANGKNYYDSNLMGSFLRHLDNPFEKLTPRELDVLVSLGKGLSNSLIAKKLFITEYTVKKHIGQIFSKLGLRDRTQAALYAYSNGLVKSNINN